jgi:hypothetical protein
MDPSPAAAAELPSSYTSDVPASSSTSGCCDIVDVPYLRSVDGLLTALDMVFSLVTFICATVWYPFVPLGGGWVQFVSITAFILSGFLYLLHVFKMSPKLSARMPFKFTEFCYYVTFTLFYFICGIVSGVNGWRDAAVVAATVFSFLSLIVFGVNSVLRFLAWRHSSEGPFFSSLAATSAPPTQTAASQY